ncbi:hypothetical protein MNV49_002970 [Pseudohyphozyma bogoriensis]|nr:hypothetical protein MNV49_002970 [Pseudohyphozyma bogoriensis]
MASLNWTLTHPTTSLPLPLPSEKTLLTLPSIAISLAPQPSSTTTKSEKKERTATGTVYLTNQRFIFISSAPPAARSSLSVGNASIVNPAGSSTTSRGDGGAAGGEPTGNETIHSISVPWSHYTDGRYVQPWFTATYYESLLLPAPGGGFLGPQLLKVYFKELGGYQFYEIVEEMKARIGEASSSRVEVEALRASHFRFPTLLLAIPRS